MQVCWLARHARAQRLAHVGVAGGRNGGELLRSRLHAALVARERDPLFGPPPQFFDLSLVQRHADGEKEHVAEAIASFVYVRRLVGVRVHGVTGWCLR